MSLKRTDTSFQVGTTVFGVLELAIPFLILGGRIPPLRGFVGWVMLMTMHTALEANVEP